MNFAELQQEVARLKVAEQVEIVVASKYFNEEEIARLALQGAVCFGENKVQDLVRKSEFFTQNELSNSNLSKIRWHFIGRLQTNKINHLLRLKPVLWQSCEGLEAALEVEKRLQNLELPYKLPTLLQIATGGNKQGVTPDLALKTYEEILANCRFVQPCGVMSVASQRLSQVGERQVASEFEATQQVFEKLKSFGAKYCSMGMSEDYKLALQIGANIVRIGSALKT